MDRLETQAGEAVKGLGRAALRAREAPAAHRAPREPALTATPGAVPRERADRGHDPVQVASDSL
jgi:hypothetical protein